VVQVAKGVVSEGNATGVLEDGVLGAKEIGISGEPLLYALEAGTVVSEGNYSEGNLSKSLRREYEVDWDQGYLGVCRGKLEGKTVGTSLGIRDQ
jgi:hypothetical protein